MLNKKNITLMLIIFMLVFSFGNSVQSADMNLKVAHVCNPDHPYHKGLLEFKEVVEKNSDIKVEIYPSGQLGGSEREYVESLQMGTLDMCLACTAPLTGFSESFMVLDLPFLFKNREHAYEVLDGKIGQEILDTLEDETIKGLSYFEVGFRNFTNNKRPINKPEDLKGLKFRLMETPVHLKSVREWGGIPTPMAIGEVFTALQQGTIDGQENPLPIIDTFNFFEVQDYLSVTEHFYSATPLLIQKNIWDNYNQKQKEVLMEAAQAGAEVCRQKNQEKNEVLLDKFKEAGMKV